MEYCEFKERLIDGLQRKYGEDAKVVEEDVLKNNDRHRDGIMVFKKSRKNSFSPTIYAEELYEGFCRGEMNMDECINENFLLIETHTRLEYIPEITGKLADWEYAKGLVYPILLGTDSNRELLEGLVSIPMLDLSIVFVIRLMMPDGNTIAKITKSLFKNYGISEQELYRQALGNMKKDGYGIRNINEVLKSMAENMGMDTEISLLEDEMDLPLYIYTNSLKYYGAAGILDKERLREVTGGRDHYIIPSSIHETILVPVSGIDDPEWLNGLVTEVNATQVTEEERLMDHVYYYDAKTDKITIPMSCI